MIQYKTIRSSNGFSLIELMISMAIGLFLIAGVLSVYINGRSAQRVVDDQVMLVDNARFAMESISADLRQAGVWGRIKNDDTRVTTTGIAVGGECAAGWVADITRPFFAFNDTSPYPGGCTSQYGAGDVIEMRYTLRDAINPPATAPLQADMVYINSDVNMGQMFIGNASPALSPLANDYPYVARAYYIAADSDTNGDGIPSLHRISLVPGPSVVDDLMLSGVQDLQIQIGLDTQPVGEPDGLVDTYVDPVAGIDWSAARTVQIWIVVRSLRNYPDIDTSTTLNVAGVPVNYPNDGFRRAVASTVVQLRNI